MQPRLITETAHAVDVVRGERIDREMTHREVDDLVGIAEGHVSKIEGFDRKWGRRPFNITPTFDWLLQSMGLALVLMDRDHAMEIVSGSSERRTTVRGKAGAAPSVGKRINLVLGYRSGS